MHNQSYTAARNNLVNNFTESLKIKEDEYLNGQLNMVSAALVNYLPEISVDRHEAIFKNVLLHKKLSILEQSTYEALDAVEMENMTDEILCQLKNKPTIICTFHTGSYRVLNLFLTKNKIPYSLVMGKEIVQQEGAAFQSLYKGLPGDNAAADFNIIDAEKPTVGLQMLRELKKGRSLLLYIDGNTGAGAATTKNDNRCVVNFLNQQLFARKGIAFLAHAAGVPIITAACYRTSWKNIKLKFFDPIFPDAGKERDLFAEQATQQIYDLLAPLVKKYPEQWEAWLYIHKVASIINTAVKPAIPKNKPVVSEKISLDSFRFGIFKLNGTCFLLRKGTYSFYEINNQLYDLLTTCNNAPVKRTSMDDILFNQLYEQGVIHYE
jgi:lauroyl/myristoyl acyltransferase